MVPHAGILCRMVDAGEIFAEIDASAGMVRFLEDPEQYTSTSAVQHLNATIQASFALAEKLHSINAQVNCTRAAVMLFLASVLGICRLAFVHQVCVVWGDM